MSYFNANMHQIRFWLGLRPRPHWGSLQRYSRPPKQDLRGLLLRERMGGRTGGKGKGGGEARGPTSRRGEKREGRKGEGRVNPLNVKTKLRPWLKWRLWRSDGTGLGSRYGCVCVCVYVPVRLHRTLIATASTRLTLWQYRPIMSSNATNESASVACSNGRLWKLDSQKEWRNTSWHFWDERTEKDSAGFTDSKENKWVGS